MIKFVFKVAACYGTPLLNLLVGVGLGCTIGIAANPAKDAIYLDVSYKSFSNSVICMNTILKNLIFLKSNKVLYKGVIGFREF
jgi:Ca2+/Na+ antiporter